jgi:purine-binding chemotaxis protein CheW
MTTDQALLLPVGDDLYALPMDSVREVVLAPAVTRLVTAPSNVLGLFNLRGHIVALFDTAALLGTGTISSAAFAVVVNSPEGPAGMAATGFPQRGVLDEPAGESELPGTNGQFHVDQRVAVLLDPISLLTPERAGDQELRPEQTPIAV